MPQSKQSTTLLVMTALPQEYKAIRSAFGAISWKAQSHDSQLEVGETEFGGNPWRVLLVESGRGNHPAALSVHQLLAAQSPDYLLFVGIGGGLKDVSIGDVVVSSKIYAYETGAEEATKFGARPEASVPASRLIDVARRTARTNWPKDGKRFGKRDPSACVEPIASGEKVAKTRRGKTYHLVRRNYNDAYAIDMEGAGVLYACNRLGFKHFLMIRGINDLCRGKGKAELRGSTSVAAANAAAYCVSLCKELALADAPQEPAVFDLASPSLSTGREHEALSTAVEIRIGDGPAHEAELSHTVIANPSGVGPYVAYYPFNCDGEVDEISVSPGIISEVVRYTRPTEKTVRLLVIARARRDVEASGKVQRQFSCRMRSAFRETNEYWTIKVPGPKHPLTITVHLPPRRPCTDWGVCVRTDTGAEQQLLGPQGPSSTILYDAKAGTGLSGIVKVWWTW